MYHIHESKYLHELFEIILPAQENFHSLYLFKQSFISAWTHGYLFYTLCYNPILFYLFDFSNCSSFGHTELFCIDCQVILIYPIYYFKHVFTFWHCKVFQAHPIHFLVHSYNQPFLRGVLVPCIREWY